MYYCAQDIIEYLMASTGGGAQDSEHRLLRQAAHHGYRDVIYARNWRWLESAHDLGLPVDGTGGKAFLLPEGVKDIDALVPPDRAIESSLVTNQEYLRLESYPSSYGDTIFYTVMADPGLTGRWRLMIAGNPSSVDPSRQYIVSYRRKPTPLRRMGFERQSRDGSMTAANSSGAVKRYGTAEAWPEGPSGINPYTAEEILGVDGSLVGTPPANARAAVSDRLDVAEYMFSAVLSGAEVWLARLQGKNVEGAMTVHARDMRTAMEADAVNPMSGRRHNVTRHPEGVQIPFSGHTSTARDMGYYSPSQPDTGT
jgi:hypothetical protein